VLPDKVIQAILRHSNVNITLGYYVKSASSDVIAAMEKFQEKLLQDPGHQNRIRMQRLDS
jgi:integrase